MSFMHPTQLCSSEIHPFDTPIHDQDDQILNLKQNLLSNVRSIEEELCPYVIAQPSQYRI